MLGSCFLNAGTRRSRATAIRKKVEPEKTKYQGWLKGVSWSRLSEQNLRVDKWSVCRD
jgi:hypothetical protein